MLDVVVVGSANLDLVAATERHPSPGETVLGHGYDEFPGGKGLNQAVAAARSGATVAFVGAVGNDAAGERLRGVLEADAIDADRLGHVDLPTGRAMIVVDDAGENSIVVIPGANGAVELAGELPTSRIVLCQLETPLPVVERALELGRTAGARTILNPAPAHSLPAALLGLADVITPNEHEVDRLGGPEALLAAGCGTVVVTLGGDGAAIHTRDETVHVRAFDVDVVDTTGAGDAFNGALACRLAAGDELPRAVRWAAAAGALATTVRGAVPAQPTAAAIEELLAG